MRNIFCKSIVTHAVRDDFIFLTGDLGYKALEPARDALGARFINAGVAEQNMVTVAAGLARRGLRPWTYSIAPFMYARPFEQIRNDVCLHSLPVVMVGNGGGYGYGVMGATHHAIEDYGSLLALQGIRAYVPAFDSDVLTLFERLFAIDHPAYLRLGLSEEPAGYAVPAYQPWRKLMAGGGPTVVVTGPLIGGLIGPLLGGDTDRRPNLWSLSELPLTALPEEFVCDLRRSNDLICIEEHVVHGGIAEMLARALLVAGLAPRRMATRHAVGYRGGRYGSQKYHRKECGLDVESLVSLIRTPSSADGA